MNPLESWIEEQRSAFLYRACATAEQGTKRAELFRRLAGEAEAQAAIWRAQLTARGHAAPGPYEPDARTRIVGRLVQAIGPRRLRRVLAAMNVRGMVIYAAREQDEGHALPRADGMIEHRQRRVGGGGKLRAAFGVNDGLVSNAALILGLSGAGAEPRVVVIAGVAGLCAGAFSMAGGKYVSVRSQREICAHQIGREREELGVDPGATGSPWASAASTFLSFAAGAFVPLAPFLWTPGDRALPVAIGITAAALFSIGALLSMFTGRSAMYAGLRMLALGSAAGAVTYAMGRLLGAAIG